MSKSLTIDTAAVWAATITVPTDGDTFQETQTDVYFESVGDRLGYLKTQADGAPSLSGTNTWTGANTFNSTVGFGASSAGVLHTSATAANASETLAVGVHTYKVPVITGNRTYTLPASGVSEGQRIAIFRTDDTSAFSVTVSPSGANLAASTIGWVIHERMGGTWEPIAWSDTVTFV